VGPPFIRFCERALDGRPLAIELAVGVADGVEGDDEVEVRRCPPALADHAAPRPVPQRDRARSAGRAHAAAAVGGRARRDDRPHARRRVDAAGRLRRVLRDRAVEEHDPSAWETGLAYLLA
jgi:hypothetical protein